MKIDGKEIEVSHPDKIYYPDDYTKMEIVEYYKKIASVMIPHLRSRPLTMLRYPDGIEGKNFFQKDAPDYFPDWISYEKLKKKEGGKVRYVLGNDKATLVYLANQGCLTPHIWLSKVEKPNHPDKLIFDLDPSDNDFSKVKFAAKTIKEFFENELKTSTFVMTTGSSGLHVVIPIKPELDFEQVLELSQDIAAYIEKQHPEKLTTAARKEKRGNKIYLDVMRNAYGQTSVAPYSLRAKPKAPVATPLEWEEVAQLKSSQKYTLSSIFKRLAQKEDPWKDMYKQAVSIKKIKTEFEKLKKE
ncbi:MAG TPA: non-homologous end-joining DNA ligase [Flavobacteriaceae bacterium]|nr:non-homologous end-joining DNA ligase [Flavobacteriaceae bacterium]